MEDNVDIFRLVEPLIGEDIESFKFAYDLLWRVYRNHPDYNNVLNELLKYNWFEDYLDNSLQKRKATVERKFNIRGENVDIWAVF